jgi:hypothetical protein
MMTVKMGVMYVIVVFSLMVGIWFSFLTDYNKLSFALSILLIIVCMVYAWHRLIDWIDRTFERKN